MILFITNHAPYTGHEKFLIDEYIELKKHTPDIKMVPLNPKGKIIHQSAKNIKKDSLCFSLFNPLLYLIAVINIITHLKLNSLLFKQIFRDSNSFRNVYKNIISFFKANLFCLIIKKINFIYAHWSSAPSSFGYFLSKLCNCPFAFVAHRGDIKENNMLITKCSEAVFIRIIGALGKDMLYKLTGGKYEESKFTLIQMGVKINPENKINMHPKPPYIILMPALFYPVKGHLYALEAIKLLSKKRSDFIFKFAGDGPVFENITCLAKKDGLDKYCIFCGLVPAEQMEQLYLDSAIVILPSINDENGHHEGVPVSLMEAMACGIPAISTRTGGIPELLEGAGILINEKNPSELCDSIDLLLKDTHLYAEVSSKCYTKVKSLYNIEINTKKIFNLISPYISS